MRAKLISEFISSDYPDLKEYMSFERGKDPKEALGIGRLSNVSMENIHNAFACVRNYSMEDLQNIYKRIRAKANISLDGVPVEKLSNHDWVEFNNKVVNGIKALRRRKSREKSSFKEGDLLKVIYKGKPYFGVYVGIDKNGRIKAKGHQVKLIFDLEEYIRATPEEEENWIKEGIALEKNQLKSKIRAVERMISTGYDYQSKLDELLKTYENKFGEKYEG